MALRIHIKSLGKTAGQIQKNVGAEDLGMLSWACPVAPGVVLRLRVGKEIAVISHRI